MLFPRMKIQDAGMILEEQPAKVAEAVKLFLQGLGHTVVLVLSLLNLLNYFTAFVCKYIV
jgi:hypothetical protein